MHRQLDFNTRRHKSPRIFLTDCCAGFATFRIRHNFQAKTYWPCFVLNRESVVIWMSCAIRGFSGVTTRYASWPFFSRVIANPTFWVMLTVLSTSRQHHLNAFNTAARKTWLLFYRRSITFWHLNEKIGKYRHRFDVTRTWPLYCLERNLLFKSLSKNRRVFIILVAG